MNKFEVFGHTPAATSWIDPSKKIPSKKNPKTIHHLGMGSFMVAGRTIKLPSKMK